MYIDPGSGSFLLQLVLAGLAGASFAIVRSWHRVRSFFSRGRKGGE